MDLELKREDLIESAGIKEPFGKLKPEIQSMVLTNLQDLRCLRYALERNEFDIKNSEVLRLKMVLEATRRNNQMHEEVRMLLDRIRDLIKSEVGTNATVKIP